VIRSSEMDGKVVSLAEGAALIPDGALVAFGGSLLHRFPGSLVRELARQDRRELRFVKSSPGYDLDLLCGVGALSEAYVGIVTMEAGLGMAPNFRARAESGELRVHEHT
jgi:glutaconate CoA-transferase subunit A